MSATARPAATIKAPARPATARLRILALQVLTLISFLGLWEYASGRWLDGFLISKPSQILPVLWAWIRDGTLWFHTRSTLANSLAGFAIGGGLAVVAGYILGQWRLGSEVLEPFITAFYTLPKVVIVPLLIFWVGIGWGLQVSVSALITFFLMFYNTFYGIRDVNPVLVDQVRLMGGRARHIAFFVRLPSAMVWVIAGLKISIPQAFVGVVVAEMLAGRQGLGFLATRHANQFDAAGTFAALIALLFTGFVIDRLVHWGTRRTVSWKTDQQRA